MNFVRALNVNGEGEFGAGSVLECASHAYGFDGGQLVGPAVPGWIASSGRGNLFSFPNVCEALDLDPSYLARGLMDRPRIAPRRVRLVVLA